MDEVWGLSNKKVDAVSNIGKRQGNGV